MCVRTFMKVSVSNCDIVSPSPTSPGILLSFYFSHWEKYITGTLYLPWFYDFSQTVSARLGGLGWWAGPSGWG